MSRQRRRDIAARSRTEIIVGAVLHLLLQGAVLYDLRKRPESDVAGPKALWAALSFVVIIGPLSYFLAGRKY